MSELCCGTCKYHEKGGIDWICVCQKSDEYSAYTDYEFVCEEWEERSTK